MSQKVRLLDVFEGKRHQKIVLTVCVLAFLLLELLIYLAAASEAGQKSRIIVSDSNGNKVYETAGTSLSSYEKLVFENNFGPLRDYRIQLHSESLPFPFRAWVSAAIGIPMALALLIAFVVRVYLTLLYGDETAKAEDIAGSPTGKKGVGAIFQSVHGISVFHIGFLIVLAVLLFWVVPNFLQDFAQVSMTAISEYKWFFLGTATFLGLVTIWIIYLRYKLSRQMLDNQLDIEKFRLERQLLLGRESSLLLPDPVTETQGVEPPPEDKKESPYVA